MITSLLPRMFGEEAARAITARNLLAPVLHHLHDGGGGGGEGLHRRCILVGGLDMLLAETADVCAAFSRFGAIEAVALLCDRAVVVYRSAAAANAAVRAPPPEGPSGPYCEAVPPLDLRPEISYLVPSFIKVAMNPPVPPPATVASRGASGAAPSSGTGLAARPAPLPEPEPDRPIPFMSEWYSLDRDPIKRAREYSRARDREYLGLPPEPEPEPEPEPATVTTTRFDPSDEHAPRRGPDGHMRVYGFKVTERRTATALIRRTEYASIRLEEV